MPRKAPADRSREQAELLAIQGLAFLAADEDRLGRFLALTGIAPSALRQAAAEPHFLAGVLDHILTDERLLVAFAADQDIAPTEIDRARGALGGHWERDIP